MKKTLSILIIVYCFQNCMIVENKKLGKFNENRGISIHRIDENIEDSVQLIKFKESEGVIFPKGYAVKTFGSSQKYFTPNAININETLIELTNQYCIAVEKFKEYRKEQNLSDLKNDTTEFQKALRYYKKQSVLFEKHCSKYQKDLRFLDKQFIGLYNEKGERIIKIQIINFKDDPYNLKSTFYYSWMSGWHGWFETNFKIMHYNLKTKTLTVNDDI